MHFKAYNLVFVGSVTRNTVPNWPYPSLVKTLKSLTEYFEHSVLN